MASSFLLLLLLFLNLSTTSSASDVPNIYAHRGRLLLSRYHERHQDIPDHDLSKIRAVLGNNDPSPTLPVGIIGAGTAGLYTAMIFESLGINYHIVDADTRERVGGRLFTHHFPNAGPYDYFVCWIPMFSYRFLILLYRILELCGSQIHHL